LSRKIDDKIFELEQISKLWMTYLGFHNEEIHSEIKQELEQPEFIFEFLDLRHKNKRKILQGFTLQTLSKSVSDI
jgi:hypothetical protein